MPFTELHVWQQKTVIAEDELRQYSKYWWLAGSCNISQQEGRCLTRNTMHKM